MVGRDQIPLLLGIGAIVVTLGVGTCSTNARIDDLNDNINNRFDDLNDNINNRFEDVNRRFEDMNGNMNNRFEDMNRRVDDVNRRIDDVQADVRELRGLLFENLQRDAPVD